eukprot:384015-Rhodomonas_salina.1
MKADASLFNLMDVVNKQAYHAYTDEYDDDQGGGDNQDYDPEQDAYEQGYKAGVADEQPDYALTAMIPSRAATLGTQFRDVAGFTWRRFGLDEPEHPGVTKITETHTLSGIKPNRYKGADITGTVPSNLQDLKTQIDIDQPQLIPQQRTPFFNQFNLLLNLPAMFALIFQCAKLMLDAVLPNLCAQHTNTLLFLVITFFVLMISVPGAASINILNSTHFGNSNVGMAAAFSISSLCTNHYLIDRGCTTLIVCNNRYLCNCRTCPGPAGRCA